MFSSEVVYGGDDFLSTAFRCGAVCHPFRERSEELQSVQRAPLLCLHCAGYLNTFCEVDEQSGEWRCSLCDFVNPPFLSQCTGENLEAYSELQYSEVEFVERDVTPIFTPAGATEHIHLFAIDTFVSSSEDIETFLRSSLDCLSEDTRVCILGFGKSINLLRLCGGGESDTAIVADTLPGTRDCAHTLRHFFQQGEYLTPACKALLIVKDVARALKCMGMGRLDNKTICTTTCTALVQVARGLGDVHGPGIKMLLITARTIPLGALPSHLMANSGIESILENVGGDNGNHQNRFSRIEGYAALGYDACVNGRCWIDAIVVGLHAVQVDLLDALVSPSGGCVVSGYSLEEEVLKTSVGHFLSLSSRCFPPHTSVLSGRDGCRRIHTDGTILFEVRTSPAIMPETIFGPVIMQYQDNSVSGWVNSAVQQHDDSSRSFSVDKAHVANSVDMTIAATNGVDSDSTSRESIDMLHKKLSDYCAKSDFVTTCSLHRADPDFSLSFLLHPNEVLTNQSEVIVQVVLRWCDVEQVASTGGSICHKTRILTRKLRCVTDKKEFLAAVDVDIWSCVAARAISGDLHAATDGLGLPKSSNEEKKDPVYALLGASEEISITKEVDDVVRELISHFKDENSAGIVKVHQLCRMLYHLREGPLLNGPCVNAQESYLLRSVFLSFSPDHFMTLVQASLQVLDIQSMPDSIMQNDPVDDLTIESWIITSAITTSPDSMNLLHDRIAVLDLGNFILIRAGIDVEDAVFEKVCPYIEKVIRRRIVGRHPYPALFSLKACSPQERMAFSRLNPSHTDTLERIQQTLPLVSSLTQAEMDENVAFMPYTDQKSYLRYMLGMAPQFARNLLGLLSNQEEGEDYLLERGRVFPTMQERSMDRGDVETHPTWNELPSQLDPPPKIYSTRENPAPPKYHPPSHFNSSTSKGIGITPQHDQSQTLNVKYPPPPSFDVSSNPVHPAQVSHTPEQSLPLSVKFPPPPPDQSSLYKTSNAFYPPPPQD